METCQEEGSHLWIVSNLAASLRLSSVKKKIIKNKFRLSSPKAFKENNPNSKSLLLDSRLMHFHRNIARTGSINREAQGIDGPFGHLFRNRTKLQPPLEENEFELRKGTSSVATSKRKQLLTRSHPYSCWCSGSRAGMWKGLLRHRNPEGSAARRAFVPRRWPSDSSCWGRLGARSIWASDQCLSSIWRRSMTSTGHQPRHHPSESTFKLIRIPHTGRIAPRTISRSTGIDRTLSKPSQFHQIQLPTHPTSNSVRILLLMPSIEINKDTINLNLLHFSLALRNLELFHHF